MRKINITSQLILLSLSVVLLTSTIFTIITLTGIYRFAEEEVFSRLHSYSSVVRTYPNSEYPKQSST